MNRALVKHRTPRHALRHVLPLKQLIEFPNRELRPLLRDWGVGRGGDGEDDVRRLMRSQDAQVLARGETCERSTRPPWTEGRNL